VAVQVQAYAAAGEPVVLLFPPSLEFVAGFWGAILAGAIAVPANLPDTTRGGRGLSRLTSILADTKARLVITSVKP